MYATLDHMRKLAQAYEAGLITSQELISEWILLLHLLYLHLLEAAWFLVNKQLVKA